MADDIRAMTAELAADPASLVFLDLAEALRRRGQLDAAQTVTRNGLARYPELASAHDLAARIFVDRGDLDRAFESWVTALKHDPALLAASLQQKLGVSKDRLMLLEDELANRLDIEEALTRWLSDRVGREALLFVYFLGHTIVDAQTGEVYLVPYDAAPDAPLYRFLPLRRLHSHLNQLDAKLSLVFIDGSQSRVNSTSGSGSGSSRT